MLFECVRVKEIWEMVSKITRINISWKHIVCGFPNYNDCHKIKIFNYIITILAYVIFKQNSRCKYENADYKSTNILIKMKCEMKWYKNLIDIIDPDISGNVMFKSFYDQFYNL